MLSGGLWKEQSKARRALHLIEPAAQDMCNHMLKWVPEARSQARDALSSKWLQGRVTSSGTEVGPAQTRQLNADDRPTAAEAQIHKVARRNATAKAKAGPVAAGINQSEHSTAGLSL